MNFTKIYSEYRYTSQEDKFNYTYTEPRDSNNSDRQDSNSNTHYQKETINHSSGYNSRRNSMYSNHDDNRSIYVDRDPKREQYYIHEYSRGQSSPKYGYQNSQYIGPQQYDQHTYNKSEPLNKDKLDLLYKMIHDLRLQS